MTYVMRLTENATGRVAEREYPGAWNDSSEFWWTDGNFGCDCNRKAEFRRATGIPEERVWEENGVDVCPCGEGAYDAEFVREVVAPS